MIILTKGELWTTFRAFWEWGLKLKVKVANEWQEQVTGLGLEIEYRNYSMIDAPSPSPPT